MRVGVKIFWGLRSSKIVKEFLNSSWIISCCSGIFCVGGKPEKAHDKFLFSKVWKAFIICFLLPQICGESMRLVGWFFWYVNPFWVTLCRSPFNNYSLKLYTAQKSIYSIPPPRVECDTRSISERITAGLNLEFSFSCTGCFIKI